MYHAGWSQQTIAIPAQGYAMHGFGKPQHRATGQQTPLQARALYLADGQGGELFFCCLDLGYVTHAMREGVCTVLREQLGESFDAARLVLTCTHTHSGPGGCSHDVLYNLVTPGFQPAHLAQVVKAACDTLLAARQTAAPTELELVQGGFDESIPVAWNRSLAAYNRNPDITILPPTQTQRGLDRNMYLLGLRREGQVMALLSLFGVHATCLSSDLHRHDGDNKGYAARHAEQVLRATGVANPVAIFAQGTAGDVSPHDQSPGARARRCTCQGEAEYVYARHNGERQSSLALSLLQTAPAQRLDGRIDAIFSYADFTAITPDPAFCNGQSGASTSEPCHGVAFFAGSPVDGPGMPGLLVQGAKSIARLVKQRNLKRIDRFDTEEQTYLRQLYAAQGPKDILMESGRKRILGTAFDKLPLPRFADPLVGELKRQAAAGAVNNSAMVPTVLPLQIVTIGALALVCCPGEFTTVAGRRVRDTLATRLAGRGITQVLICTYCNDYMGYVTTFEEYQEQAYEGGHTIFGQWTLAAFQTRFAALAEEFGKPEAERCHDRTTRPAPAPAEELARRSGLSPR